MEFRSTEEILRFAITQEERARDFYLALAEQVTSPQVRKALPDFAEEEAGHKRKLEEVVAGRLDALPSEAPEDLRISDPMPELEATPDMDYQAALQLAMKAEDRMRRLYEGLAAAARTAEMRETFLALAREEGEHKLLFERAYDDDINRDN